MIGALLAGLGWGLWRLERVFRAERAEAVAAIAARRTALAHYAREALARRLSARLRAAGDAIDAAAADPLRPAAGLYLRIDGEVRLPRRPPPPGAAVAVALHETLRDPERDPPEAAPGSPWAERLALHRRFVAAVRRDDAAAVEDAFRDLLTHRVRYVLEPARDLPLMISLLELFIAEGRPDPDLLRAVLRDGVVGSDGARLPGLQRQFLRARLSTPDRAALGERIARLSERAGVPADDLRARLAAAPAAAPAPTSTPASLVPAGGAVWYVEARSPEEARGVVVDVPALVAAVGDELRAGGLLDAEGRVALLEPWPPAEARPVTALPIGVESPAWARAEAAAGTRFRVKTALAAATGALALAVAGLGLLFQRRRRRFLDLQAEFVATVSHELRTPLASIRLLAETLQRRLRGDPRAGDYPARLVRDAEGLGLLVENILSFNRLERGRLVPRKRPVRLAEVVGAVRDDVERHARTPVRWHFDGLDDIELDADPELLALLLLNLARNACQHNERDPVEIRIAAARDPRRGHVVVRVADNGVGIAPADRRRVFAAFHRAGARGRGAGLGLAICRRVADLHGGTLRIAASGPEGTTFELRLPTR